MSLLSEEELKLFQDILVELRLLRATIAPPFFGGGAASGSTYMIQCAVCKTWYASGTSHSCPGKITYTASA
jgi:hypothetical protein